MARIRSIHPGLFTDEAFASLSEAAQVFLMGIWTEADDQGVFEWKPITLRMRLRPTKDGDVEPLLAELCTANSIMSYELNGRKYGLVRNFRKFQRPKKPNSVHLLPDQFRTYVGLNRSSTEPEVIEENSVPQKGEMSPQMEEEGGRKKERKKKEDTADAVLPPAALFFEAGIIRLTKKDFEQWERAFSHLDLGAELLALRQWAEEQGPSKWYFAVSGALGKRNREVKMRKDQASSPTEFKWKSGIEGVV